MKDDGNVNNALLNQIEKKKLLNYQPYLVLNITIYGDMLTIGPVILTGKNKKSVDDFSST